MARVVIQYLDLGRVDYSSAMARQQELVRLVQADSSQAYMLLVEHDPPAITIGRRGRFGDVLADRESLASRGIEVHHVPRGGAVTLHGPGQLVVYPIFSLRTLAASLGDYVHRLEEVLIGVLGDYGIAANRSPAGRGVWVGAAKIAAIGVAVGKWVCSHGAALNVQPNLEHFGLIVPCGQAGAAVTSIEKLLGRRVDMADVRRRFAARFADVFDVEIRPSTAPPPLVVTKPLRKPPWLRRKICAGGQVDEVRRLLAELHLGSVCESAHCPNRSECYASRTATFMILGRHCTRRCRFCAVEHGDLEPPRQDEPQAVATAAKRLGLRHVVVTSVTRDDLADGGAGQFARTIEAIRGLRSDSTSEVLTPDFQGDRQAIDTVLSAGPDVFNHNLETVRRLYGLIRPGCSGGPDASDVDAADINTGRDEHPRANYDRSLAVLGQAAQFKAALEPGKRLFIKSGIMLGLGETADEVSQVLSDLRRSGCEMLTIGQYLQPSPSHLRVARYVSPDEFAAWRQRAEAMGFLAVAAGPYIRSSYKAQLPERL